MSIVPMVNVVMASANVIQDIQALDAILHVGFFLFSFCLIFQSSNRFLLADQCAGVICNYGTCYEGRCSCSEGYTGPFCDTLSKKNEQM